MCSNVMLIPLGGAQSIGSSCYLLVLGHNKILLDCGSTGVGERMRGPDFTPLFEKGIIHSVSEITHVFISHAHQDHVGYLPYLLMSAPNTPVYMTDMTKMLTRFQLFDNVKTNLIARRGTFSQMYLNDMLARLQSVCFFESIHFGEFQVTIYPAGHIPGAMMVLFSYRGENILYTGDYSFNDTGLTSGCIIPRNVKVDKVIMCGTHAKHSEYKKSANQLTQKAKQILDATKKGQNVFCKVRQLSKGIELLAELNKLRSEYSSKVPIYIDEALMNVVKNLELTGIPIIRPGNMLLNFGKKPIPHITIAQGEFIRADYNETIIDVDFALHDDFEEMKDFIINLNPKEVIVVHCGKPLANNKTIEDLLLWDPNLCTSFYFPEEGEFCKL